MAKWRWNTSVDVRSKKCTGCKKPMFLALDHAIIFEDKDWHLHCLLDMLTESHHDSLELQQELAKEWGNAP